MNRGLPLLVLLLLGPLTIGAQVPNLDPKARPNGPFQIRGKVVNAQSGQPIAGAEIQIYESARNIGDMFELTESEADGSFHFDGIAEGKYTLMAARRGYAPQSYLQHENFWTAIAVGSGKDSLHVKFPLYPSALITGQVTDENGEAVRLATVKLWKESLEEGAKRSSMAGQTATDDQGKYRFEHLAAGHYTVSAAATPWYRRLLNAALPGEDLDSGEPASAGVTSDTSSPETTKEKKEENPENFLPELVYPVEFYPTGRTTREASWFQMRPGEEQTADFQLNTTPGFRVLVRTGLSEGGGPWRLRFLSEGEEGGPEYSGAKIRQVAPNVVEVSGVAPGSYRLRVDTGRLDGIREEKVVVDGDAQFDFEKRNSVGPLISGTLRFAQPPANYVWVVLQIRDEAGNKSKVQTSPKPEENAAVAGRQDEFTFQFGNQAPGGRVYELSALTPQGTAIEKLEATGARVDGNTFTLDGTGEVHLNVIASENTVPIRATAVKKGQPFAGAMILLLPENGQAEFVRRDQSDSDGTFTLANVVPGKYWLMALENGWELPWADAEQQKALLGKGVAVVIGKNPPPPFKIEVE
ncbi:MAG TPA: carboxypeptidase-like regulatory domain-containing protein [Candidatus Limnocylindrales bacterium]|nr:carboxypeptidase-like regulatory domain-containing protein [Candidatus Limnocylindrales bacterium]